MSGLEIPFIKFSNKHQTIEKSTKPVIILVGRLNPGQTYTSFVMHGLLNFLCSQDAIIHKLRELYEVWVLPMLNPDGVVLGNSERNVSGKVLGASFYPDLCQDGYLYRAHETEILRALLK